MKADRLLANDVAILISTVPCRLVISIIWVIFS